MALPDHYLEQVYAAVRAGGGLAIADEVQVAYGRLGNWFWGFQQQNVIPDIVSVAKSTGNGGAAIAGYAAAGGLKAKILVPAPTSPDKIVQARAYGAEIELIPGTRQDVSDEAVRQAETIFYAGHNWQPFFLQGAKTLAYELWEDLKFNPPDNVIIPTGAGSNVLGCDIGFSELLRRREIGKLPRLFAAQPENCAPLHASFAAGSDDLIPVEARPTIYLPAHDPEARRREAT